MTAPIFQLVDEHLIQTFLEELQTVRTNQANSDKALALLAQIEDYLSKLPVFLCEIEESIGALAHKYRNSDNLGQLMDDLSKQDILHKIDLEWGYDLIVWFKTFGVTLIECLPDNHEMDLLFYYQLICLLNNYKILDDLETSTGNKTSREGLDNRFLSLCNQTLPKITSGLNWEMTVELRQEMVDTKAKQLAEYETHYKAIIK